MRIRERNNWFWSNSFQREINLSVCACQTTTISYLFVRVRQMISTCTVTSNTLFSWCSGYHIRLTRGRSPVRSRAKTLPFCISEDYLRLSFTFRLEFRIYFVLTFALNKKWSILKQDFSNFEKLSSRNSWIWESTMLSNTLNALRMVSNTLQS